VDSERLVGELMQKGLRLRSIEERVDAVLINTCSFLEASCQESRQVIEEMLDRKRRGEVSAVVVVGCLVERVGQRLQEELPEIDVCLGTEAWKEVTPALMRVLEQRNLYRPASVRPATLASGNGSNVPLRTRITPRHYAYLKISEGCDRTCTFCAIPSIRGPLRSVPIEQIVQEARQLAEDGARELILVAQDLTAYGVDRTGQPLLAELLRRLDQLDAPFDWLRLLYAFPEHIDDTLLEVAAQGRRIVPYLDMPLQHVVPHILRRMGRPYHPEAHVRLLERIRRNWPGVVLRTTFIVGFPGETDADFEQLLRFIQEHPFERLGAFAYSREAGTAADRLDGHLPEEIKQQRLHELMLTQQAIAFRYAQQQVGRSTTVLVDGADPQHPRHWIARSPADAPEIDPIVRVKAKHLRPGDLIPVTITAADGYDLVARPHRP
jgi:ribosomal protein S12 methylthiotransferase